MTTTIAREVSKRKAPPPGEASFSSDLVRELTALVARATTVRFPNPKYQRNPVAFFREVLGIEPWDRQVEVIEAIRDHTRVAVCSGHKIGKSNLIAGAALWFYCSFEDARAIMSSTTSRQVDQILWRELRMLRARSGRCVACKVADPEGMLIPKPCPHSAIIDGEQGELARTGLKSEDFREIVGFTAREAEAVAGISGRNLLYLLDEASGIPDVIYEAVEGNRAGGARIVLAGNGTRNEGEFFEAFNSKSHLYKTIRVSSETTPNVVHGRVLIPGLATREWIEEKKLEWGEGSALYRVRVKGEHATFEAGKIFSLHTIGESEKRWFETPESGRLFIGVDPAGETGSGDETVFCVRRGLKMLLLEAHQGLTAEMHLVHLLRLLKFRLPRETPVVVIDREGSVGSKLSIVLRNYLEDSKHVGMFELVTVRASSGAVRQPQIYDRLRDELAANLEQWFRDGGAILEDVRLSRELHAFEWKQAVNGKLKITPKELVRKMIGRSPDRYDSLALSAWEPLSLREAEGLSSSAQQIAASEYVPESSPILDSYAGAEIWQRGQ
jgi:phage terminase large subunit